jgi:glycosyltransferase involved in cell wall biosynthesis
MTNKVDPQIFIIILTYNSQSTIRNCLAAINNLDYPADSREIVILDNGSSDDTLKIIHEMGFTFYSLPELNLSELRNYGANIATSEIIAYVDSDCVIFSDWITQVVKWFDDPKIGIVGNEYLLPSEATVFEKNWYNQSNYGLKEDDLIPAGNMAINRKIFIKLGGFDESLVSGEDDYILKKFRSAGYKTISDYRIKSIHLGNAKTLIEYFRKETWYGFGMLGTLRFNKFDKPLIATIIFLLLIFSLISSIFFFIATNSDFLLWIIISTIFGIILIPFLAALERTIFKKRRGNIFYVTLIFIILFLARINSLTYILGFRNMKHQQ